MSDECGMSSVAVLRVWAHAVLAAASDPAAHGCGCGVCRRVAR